MKTIINKIDAYLKSAFEDNQERLNHIYFVRDMAVFLGKIHDVSIDKLTVAALLHDATKDDDLDNIKAHVSSFVSDEEIRDIPKGCLHAYSARVLANKKFHITDEDILNAITYHCSCRPSMSKLEQIIFISDYIEESRAFVGDDLRLLARKDLDLTTYKIISQTIDYLQENRQKVSRLTYEALKFYQKQTEVINEQ